MESTADETAARNVSSYFATSVADETAARDVTSYFVTSVAEHVVAVITISLACFIGNGVVIHVYRSKRGNSFGKLYIILLAIIDIFACCTLLPVYPLLRLEAVRRHVNYVFTFTGLISVVYAWILLTMTLERVLAIFRPFAIVANRKKLHKMALVLFICHISSVVLASALNLSGGQLYGRYVMMVHFLFLFAVLLIMVVGYPAMIYKIIFHRRSVAKYEADDGSTSISKEKRRQKNVTTACSNR